MRKLPLLLLLVPVLAIGTIPPARMADLVERYNRARAAIAEQHHDQALRHLQSLVRDYGRTEFGDELRFTLAETQYNVGEFERSRAQFSKIVSGARRRYIIPEAMLGEALSLIMLGRHEHARQTLENLGRHGGYDRDERTNFAFGVLHYSLGEYEQAVARLTGLTMPEALFYLAKCQSVTGRPLNALKTFNEIINEAPNTPLAAMSQFAAGKALFENRDFDGARAKFQFFISQSPQSSLVDYAHYFLGCALLAQGREAEALIHLMPLTRHNNRFLAAHANYFIGHARLALDSPEEAIKRYQQVRSNFPNTHIAGLASLQLAQATMIAADTAQTLLATSQLDQIFRTGYFSGVGSYLSGTILYRLGRYTEASRNFEEVLARYTETDLHEPACAMLLLTLNSAGLYERAVALGTKYINDYPDVDSEWRARTLYSLAEAFYYFERYGEADAYYQQAYSHTTGSDIIPYARLGRSYSLYHLGRLDEAYRGFEELLSARPSDTSFTIKAYLGYGYSLFNRKEYTQALDVFEALANTFPDDRLATIPGHFYAGYSYYQLGYYGQAVDAWTTLVNRFPERNPKAAEAAFRTGDTYFKALEYDKAIASFNFVIERNPDSEYAPPSQALIAQCYYNRSQYLDAVREYQKFLDLYPHDEQSRSVRQSLEMAYYLAGTEDSLVMQDFLSRYPRSEMASEGQFDLGRELFDQGRYDEAISKLQIVVVNFPGSPLAGDAQLLTAESYARQERWNEAATAYRRFIEYFPDHRQVPGAWFNLGTAHFNVGDFQRSLASFATVADDYPESEYAESARQNAAISRRQLGVDTTDTETDRDSLLESDEPGPSPQIEGDQP